MLCAKHTNTVTGAKKSVPAPLLIGLRLRVGRSGAEIAEIATPFHFESSLLPEHKFDLRACSEAMHYYYHCCDF